MVLILRVAGSEMLRLSAVVLAFFRFSAAARDSSTIVLIVPICLGEEMRLSAITGIFFDLSRLFVMRRADSARCNTLQACA